VSSPALAGADPAVHGWVQLAGPTPVEGVHALSHAGG